MSLENRFDYDDAAHAADYVRARMEERGMNPDDVAEGLTLGSGLGSFAEQQMGAAEDKGISGKDSGPLEIPYKDVFMHLNGLYDGRRSFIPALDRNTVPGHAKKLVIGPLKGESENEIVIGQSGREHLYEDGISPRRATFWLRLMQLLGAKAWIGSNASGALTPKVLTPPTVMLVEAHVDETGANPLKGKNDKRFGPRFPHMSGLYSRHMIELFEEVAREDGVAVDVVRGVYWRLSGPQYEQPADVYRMRGQLQQMYEAAGGQPGEWRHAGPVTGAVGMSSTYEALVAQHASQSKKFPAFTEGIALLSAVTNYSASLGPDGFVEPSNHEEVEEMTKQIEDDFAKLVKGAISRLRASKAA